MNQYESIIKVDKNIPIPTDLGWMKKLEFLKVGESFTVLSGSEDTVRQVSWREFHKKGTKRFTTQIDPTDPANYRTWRTK